MPGHCKSKNKMIIIRKATIKDCKIVHGLSSAKELKTPRGDAPELWWIEAFVKEKQIFFVAEDKNNKTLAGFVFGERTTGDIYILHEIFVRKEYRHHGIGTILMKKAENECRKRHLRVILLYGYNSKPMHKLLEEGGYEKGNPYNEFVKFLR